MSRHIVLWFGKALLYPLALAYASISSPSARGIIEGCSIRVLHWWLCMCKTKLVSVRSYCVSGRVARQSTLSPAYACSRMMSCAFLGRSASICARSDSLMRRVFLLKWLSTNTSSLALLALNIPLM